MHERTPEGVVMRIFVACFLALSAQAGFADDRIASVPAQRDKAIAVLKEQGAVTFDETMTGPSRRVITVTLVGSSATDEMIDYVIQLPELRFLDIHTLPRPGASSGFFSMTHVTSKGMDKLKRLPNLRSLTLLLDDEVNDSDIVFLDAMPDLRSLKVGGLRALDGGRGVTERGLSHVKRPDKLETLWFMSRRINDESLAHLEGFTGLRELNITSGNDVTGAGLVHLTELKGLTSLTLGCPSLSDDGMKHLAVMTQLRSLDVYSMKVTDRGVEHLKGLSNLRHLSLYHAFAPMGVTDAGFKHLQGMEQLRSLSLGIKQLSDAGLAHLAALQHLERLDLTFIVNREYTEAGLELLRKALPDLVITP
jgi:hypothetical protein